MRVLFLSRWFPYPTNNGSKIRVFNLLRGLAKRHEVTLLSFADQSERDYDIPEVNAICRQVQVVPWKPFIPTSMKARLGFLRWSPRSVLDTFSAEMAEQITRAVNADDYHLVIASQITMAGYIRYFGDIAAVFEEIEVGMLYEQTMHAQSSWQRLRHGLTWSKHRNYLAGLLRHFQAATVVSERERQLLQESMPNDRPRVEIIPNCVDLAEYRNVVSKPRHNTLIFTGSFSYLPNHEAMDWFLLEVYPRVQAQIPDIQLTITGHHAGRTLPPASNVEAVGFVDDVKSLVASSWVSLAPLLSGGGTRLKILEAMALHTPVVATSKGAEGLDVVHEEHVLIADTAEAFAECILRLLREPELRRRLVDKAYQLLFEKYDWSAVMPRFTDLIERVAHE